MICRLLDGRANLANTIVQHVLRKREPKIIFGQHPCFAIEVDIVAVVFYFQLRYFHYAWLLPVRQRLKFHLERDVFGSIARRIDVCDVRSDKFLTRRREVHIFFKLLRDSIQHMH